MKAVLIIMRSSNTGNRTVFIYLFIFFVFGKNCSDFEDNIPLPGNKRI